MVCADRGALAANPVLPSEAVIPAVCMSSRADYAVSRVRYSADRLRIFRAHVHRIRPAALGPPLQATRFQLVAAIRAGRRFVAVDLRTGNTLATASLIHLVEDNGQFFLRTDPAIAPRDLLDGIQEF